MNIKLIIETLTLTTQHFSGYLRFRISQTVNRQFVIPYDREHGVEIINLMQEYFYSVFNITPAVVLRKLQFFSGQLAVNVEINIRFFDVRSEKCFKCLKTYSVPFLLCSVIGSHHIIVAHWYLVESL